MSTDESSKTKAMAIRAQDLHRKLLERVLLRSDTKNVKDVFRGYDKERAGVLTLPQFRALMRDHQFLDAEANLLLHHLDVQEHSVSFHAFMGDALLGAEQSYPSKKSHFSKKVQQLAQFSEQKKPFVKEKGTDVVSTRGTLAEQDPMEVIRIKLRQRVMGHDKSIREVFMEYDTDGSGYLDYEEFDRLMAKYDFTLDETQMIVAYLDRDRSGTVDYEEFAAGLLFYRPPVPVPIVSAPIARRRSSLKAIENESDTQRQLELTLSKQASRLSNEAGFQQILETVQSKFSTALKRSKLQAGGVNKLRAEFDRFDVDDKQSLDHQEFSALLVGLGIKLKRAELRTLLDEIDPNEEERIQFPTITKILNVQEANWKGCEKNDQQQIGPVAADGEVLIDPKKDKEGKGLDYEQFRRVLHENGISDDSEIDAMIENLDKDKRRFVKLSDFVQVYAHQFEAPIGVLNGIVTLFGEYDRNKSAKVDLAECSQSMNKNGGKEDDGIAALTGKDNEDGIRSLSLQKSTCAIDQELTSHYIGDSDELASFQKVVGYDRNRLESSELRRVMPEVNADYKNESHTLTEDTEKKFGYVGSEDSTREYNRKIEPALELTQAQLLDACTEVGDYDNVEKRIEQTSQVMDQELQYVEQVHKRQSSIETTLLVLNHKGKMDLDVDVQRLARREAELTERVACHEEKVTKSVICHEDKVTKSVARDDKVQNTSKIRANPPNTKRRGKSNATSDSTAYDIKVTTKSTHAARLRKLKEKWIRRALARHDSLSSVFAAVDSDEDGRISRDEFRKLMNLYGIQNEGDVAALMKTLSVGRNGCIEFKDFAKSFNEARVVKVVASIPEAVTKSLAAPIDTKSDHGMRLREVQIKWIKRVLSCHDSIESAFHQYDKDGNGELNYEEFHYFMTRYGIVRNVDIDALIKCLDTDGSGTISLEEFLVIFNSLRVNSGITSEGMRAIAVAASDEMFDAEELVSILEIERELAQRMAHQTRDLRLAFRKIDTNGNGLLEYKEFRNVLKSYRLPEVEIRKVIRHLDRNVSGFIDYKQFIAGFSAFKESGGSVPATQKKGAKVRSIGKERTKL